MILPGSSSHQASSRSPCQAASVRSEEHTSELQSRLHLVCRLLLEKKKNTNPTPSSTQPYLTTFFLVATLIHYRTQAYHMMTSPDPSIVLSCLIPSWVNAIRSPGRW